MRRRPRRVLERLARDASRTERPRTRIDGLGRDLARAIEQDALTLSFQPIVSVRAARCDRVEALLRWTHQLHGPVDPRDVIAAADESALLLPLAVWVIRAVGRERRTWGSDGLALGVSVNLEGPELVAADALLTAVAEAGLNARDLTVDVRAGATADARVRDGLRALAAGGVRIALDEVTPADAPARRFTAEIDELKVARSVVRRAVADEASRSALRGLLALARDTGLAAVAVGVDDAPTWRLVASLGCDLAQGNWASRPLVTAEVPSWHHWVARLALSGTAALVATAGISRSETVATGPAASEVSKLPVPPSGCCTVRALPAPAPTLDLPTRTYDTGAARLVVDDVIGDEIARALAGTIAADRADVEASLGTPLARTPTIYVLATRVDFAHVLERSFGQSAMTASVLAGAHGGIAFPDRASVVLNWQNLGAGPLTIVRHELTHLLVHQLAGGADVPAWLDEGLATLAERDTSRDPITALRDGAAALALLARDEVALTALASPEEWVLGDAGSRGSSYVVSAEASRLLRERIGMDGITRLLIAARIDGFATAFGGLVGTSPADFERAFPAEEARMRGGLRVAGARDGAGSRWAVAGAAAGSTVHVAIDGDSYHVAFDVTLGPDGVYEGLFGPTSPPGRYVLVASAGSARATQILDVG